MRQWLRNAASKSAGDYRTPMASGLSSDSATPSKPGIWSSQMYLICIPLERKANWRHSALPSRTRAFAIAAPSSGLPALELCVDLAAASHWHVTPGAHYPTQNLSDFTTHTFIHKLCKYKDEFRAIARRGSILFTVAAPALTAACAHLPPPVPVAVAPQSSTPPSAAQRYPCLSRSRDPLCPPRR